MKEGGIHGETDELGSQVTKDPVTPGDLHATVGWALGLNPDQPIFTPSGRPIPVGGHGAKVAMEVFA
ncbi:MAG: DUF1501 domain-containing protein [Phycisphaera sp.]|nr:DUF1501 domain-containing protein [Phycisphaera sp.]